VSKVRDVDLPDLIYEGRLAVELSYSPLACYDDGSEAILLGFSQDLKGGVQHHVATTSSQDRCDLGSWQVCRVFLRIL
jgi:hypothetical protein